MSDQRQPGAFTAPRHASSPTRGSPSSGPAIGSPLAKPPRSAPVEPRPQWEPRDNAEYLASFCCGGRPSPRAATAPAAAALQLKRSGGSSALAPTREHRASAESATMDFEPRLFKQLVEALRVRHYSPRTEQAYVGWVRRFVRANGRRNPAELGQDEVQRFLTTLATSEQISASTQSQALAALLFLYDA